MLHRLEEVRACFTPRVWCLNFRFHVALVVWACFVLCVCWHLFPLGGLFLSNLPVKIILQVYLTALVAN
jgi:hypothetical protein